MASHLYVSFWDLCLDNLASGRFERRVNGSGEASAMLCAARADKTLLCVSKDDLLAPYRTKERRRHQELCTVLRASYNCPLRLGISSPPSMTRGLPSRASHRHR